MPLVPTVRFRADIEGLRAIAILLVVGHHVGAPGLSGGFIGVDVFFVLSGYLITWLLVAELERTGRIDFAGFYARRARRLLPALALVLAAVVVASALLYAPFEQVRFARSAAAAALYASNLVFAFQQTSYFWHGTAPDLLLHTWSLGVEEQFYAAWPLLLAAAAGVLGRRRVGPVGRGRLVRWLGAVVIASFALSLALSATHPVWAFYLSPTRAWQFGAGGLAVLLPLGRWPGGARVGPAVGGAGLVTLFLASAWIDGRTLYPGVAAVVPVVATVALLRSGAHAAGAGNRADGVTRALSARPLQELGRLSYSWYLWHWPAVEIASLWPGGDQLGPRVLAAAVAFGLAKATFHLVEDPLRRRASLAAQPRRTLAATALLTAGLAAGAGGWALAARAWQATPGQAEVLAAATDLPLVTAHGCAAPTERSTLLECTFGAADAPRTAVLVGDSQAEYWSSVVEPLIASGRWRVVTLVKPGCHLIDHVGAPPWLGRQYRECEAWLAAAVDRIEALRPEVTLTVSSTRASAPLDDPEGVLGPTFGAAADASGHVVVLLGIRLPAYDVPACVARSAWRPALAVDCPPLTTETDPAQDVYVAFAESRPNVDVVDVTPFLCDAAGCFVERGGRPYFSDRWHVANWVVREAAPSVSRAIELLAADAGRS